MNSSDHAVEISGLTLTLGGTTILEDIDLTVEHGDYLAVLGANGGGKSTLLKVMLGLLKPDSGSVRILGMPPGEAGGRIGYLPQYTHVSASFPITVVEAVRMGLVSPGRGMLGITKCREETKRAMGALERVGMDRHARKRVSDLSGGQKQRVFIARALVSDPQLLLLDEPTASVDPQNRVHLFDLLLELNKNMTVIMVSHDISAVAHGVKSVACVNRTLHFHPAPAITGPMVRMSYGGDEDCCPIELVTHGDIPHRVLGKHDQDQE
ncbi:metal ABC transporter ATP-binding protein [Salidesulfovibrio brasiliensis]|uniref:metal ABC transporter ATP-binding protein n=1 Tax=Salidesulfovibrio brasiliensis TaxID=221711 RepID=UPI0006D082A6|nr:ABC transporter ATP-binding protein [Salidesulfovibrio brasiliensis]